MTSNTWYHVVAIFLAPNSYNIYVNGIVCEKTTGTAPKNNSTVGTKAMWFVGKDNGYSARCFNGLLDDARIYPRALSSTEVWNLYNLGCK
jgi:hypothetical protein